MRELVVTPGVSRCAPDGDWQAELQVDQIIARLELDADCAAAARCRAAGGGA